MGIVILIMSVPGTCRADDCGCNDVRDIRNRICEAKAAISEYERQIYRLKSKEQKDGKPYLLTKERYEGFMQPCVQEALDSVIDEGATRSTAKTLNNCTIEVFDWPKKPTACVRKALLTHEAIHQQVCRKFVDVTSWEAGFISHFASIFKEFREGMSMMDMAKEEIVAYQQELGFLRMQLLQLSERCPKTMFTVQRPDGQREFTLEFCPPPRPRPSPEESACKVR